MDARDLRCLVIAAAALTCLPALAQSQSEDCQLPTAESEPLTERAELLARYERLPRSCLQEIFRACSHASSRSLLDFGSAATCSFGYEALLSQGFGGDFRALIAWWRSEREPTLQ